MLMLICCLLVAIFGLSWSGAESAPVPEVTLRADGFVVLSAEDRKKIADRVKDLVVGCGMTSVSSPDVFATWDLDALWRETRAGRHLHLRYEEPLRTTRRGLAMSEVVVGLADPSFIGPELTRHEGRVLGHVKCDGSRALALMCATALRGHLLPGQRRNCEVFDRIPASPGSRG